jgi:hypothetical protein
VSAPIEFSGEQSAATLLAALALVALLAASTSHIGLIYTVWKRAPG